MWSCGKKMCLGIGLSCSPVSNCRFESKIANKVR
jgi:hypothetical protein